MLARFFTYKSIIPFVISLAMFMESLDATIINTAIPVMAKALNVHPIDLKIALISYLLSLAIFIPISGWVADKFGIKRVFIGALIIFTLSSIWCGFSHTLFELVIGRTLQGLGGSFALPVGRLLLVRFFPRHELISTMNRVLMLAALGLMLGPVLGGFITQYFSWRWIFWVNIPVGIFTILLATIWIQDVAPEKVPPLDKIGFILFGSSLAGFTFGLSALSESFLSNTVAFLIISLSVGLMFLYIVHSRRRKYPILKTALFKIRTFQISVLGNLCCRTGFGGVPFLLPLLFQVSLHYSPQWSGILIAPMALGVLLIKFFTLPLLRLLGYKRLLTINTMIVSLATCLFAWITPNTAVYMICVFTFIFGFLISLQYSSMNSIAYADLPSENLSAATSIMSTLQQLSQSFGVALAALLVRLLSPSPQGKFVLTTEVFHHTFYALGFITLLSTVIFIRLKPTDGEGMLKSEKTLQAKI